MGTMYANIIGCNNHGRTTNAHNATQQLSSLPPTLQMDFHLLPTCVQMASHYTMYVVEGHRYIGIRFQLLSFNWCVCHSLWHHYYHSLCSLSAAFISPNCSNLLNLTLIWIWIMGCVQTSDYEIVSINHSKKSFLFISWLMKCRLTRRLHWNPFFHENMLIISTIVTVMRDAITIIPIIYLSQ